MDNPRQSTILVVEDVSEIAAQIEGLLRRKGHRTVIASDAKEAMRIANANRPALIISDQDVPTFGSLIQSIRGHATLNDLIVVVIDINEPEINAGSNVKVLKDFNELDQLLASTIA